MGKWKVKQKQYWNKIALSYNSLYSEKWSILEDKLTEYQLKWMKKNNYYEILDLACGRALGYDFCQNIKDTEKFHYTGIDIADKMIELNNLNYKKAVFYNTSMKNIDYIPNNSIDVVLCLNTSLSYTDDIDLILKQIMRVLKNDGKAFLSVLNKNSIRRTFVNNYQDIEKNKIEKYQTRGIAINDLYAPAYLYSKKEIIKIFHTNNFKLLKFYGVGFFSGVFEKPFLWSIDRVLSKLFSEKCHSFNILIEKGSN